MVIILQKFFHNVPELGLRRQNKVIQTLLLEGLYKGFHIAVTLRRSRRDRFCLAANRMNNVLEARTEQRIAVMDKILLPQQLSTPHVALISGNLRHPVSVGIMGNAAQPDLAGKYVFKEKNVLLLTVRQQNNFLPDGCTINRSLSRYFSGDGEIRLFI